MTLESGVCFGPAWFYKVLRVNRKKPQTARTQENHKIESEA